MTYKLQLPPPYPFPLLEWTRRCDGIPFLCPAPDSGWVRCIAPDALRVDLLVRLERFGYTPVYKSTPEAWVESFFHSIDIPALVCWQHKWPPKHGFRSETNVAKKGALN